MIGFKPIKFFGEVLTNNIEPNGEGESDRARVRSCSPSQLLVIECTSMGVSKGLNV